MGVDRTCATFRNKAAVNKRMKRPIVGGRCSANKSVAKKASSCGNGGCDSSSTLSIVMHRALVVRELGSVDKVPRAVLSLRHYMRILRIPGALLSHVT